ncbi:hypothetical protein [Streptomyces sp. NPDC018584]|uniref:hypothetical protein n=1 Tax=unclassified Streptomyces TaxID=2593676 RepID=UPI0037A46EA6
MLYLITCWREQPPNKRKKQQREAIMEYTYDPAAQLNILPDGTPVIDTDAIVGPTMTHSSGDTSGPRKDDE